jgi:hypothetical protein
MGCKTASAGQVAALVRSFAPNDMATFEIGWPLLPQGIGMELGRTAAVVTSPAWPGWSTVAGTRSTACCGWRCAQLTAADESAQPSLGGPVNGSLP